MVQSNASNWQQRVVKPEVALRRIEPGMNIFIGTGTAEPRTLVKHLMASKAYNLQDLTLIQLVSFGDAISLEALQSHKYRLKTFFSGWVASEAINAGYVDLIPSRFSTIPQLIRSGQIPIDVALIQITPPNESGYCSLGVGVDVARQAMDQADLIVGEINTEVPFTYGDTFVPVDQFDLLVQSPNRRSTLTAGPWRRCSTKWPPWSPPLSKTAAAWPTASDRSMKPCPSTWPVSAIWASIPRFSPML
jgi:acyl-CoA hydrolase